MRATLLRGWRMLIRLEHRIYIYSVTWPLMSVRVWLSTTDWLGRTIWPLPLPCRLGHMAIIRKWRIYIVYSLYTYIYILSTPSSRSSHIHRYTTTTPTTLRPGRNPTAPARPWHGGSSTKLVDPAPGKRGFIRVTDGTRSVLYPSVLVFLIMWVVRK